MKTEPIELPQLSDIQALGQFIQSKADESEGVDFRPIGTAYFWAVDQFYMLSAKKSRKIVYLALTNAVSDAPLAKKIYRKVLADTMTQTGAETIAQVEATTPTKLLVQETLRRYVDEVKAKK